MVRWSPSSLTELTSPIVGVFAISPTCALASTHTEGLSYASAGALAYTPTSVLTLPSLAELAFTPSSMLANYLIQYHKEVTL